jgi:hypothetical protein
MTMQIIKRRVPMLATFAMLPGILLAAIPTPQHIELQKEGIQLIGQVEASARDIRSHAAHLDSLSTNLRSSRQTHYDYLSRIRSSVNDALRPAVERLAEIQPELPEWKQQSIHTMINGAAELAAHATEAITTASDGPAHPAMNIEYKELVTRVYEQADSLVKTSDAAGDYGSARLKALNAGVRVPQS